MDIDGLVTKLMTAERAQQTKLKQKVQTLDWKQDAYRAINTMAASLKDMSFNLRFSSNWQKTTSTTSDSTKLTVASDATAQVASHQISISQLASVASNASPSGIYSAAGKTGTLDPNADLQSQATALGFTLSSNSVVINGKSITVDPAKSLNDFISQVNTSGAGVTMTYDSFSDKVVVATNSTGAQAKIDFTGTSSFNNTVLGMVGLSSATKTGSDASITIDGLNTTRPTNSFNLNGVTYNLLGTTAVGQTVSVNVGTDIASIKKSITDFVDKYNTMISTLSTKLNETKFKGFSPLTDEQKTAMKDSEITLWNQKAQSGALQRDDALQKAYSDLRTAVSSKVTNVTGSISFLANIGISTGTYNSSDQSSAGKLIIDQSKLDAALASDQKGVIEVFSKVGAPGSTDRGIAQKVSDIMTDLVSTLNTRAGKSGGMYNNITTNLGAQVGILEGKVSAWDTKLASKENYYFQMFSKMDSAIGNGNAQMSWLSQQFK
ncbi:flagellar hook-associated protein 2 [Paenibacillus sp. V4I3]|uniref:flagellar filament capping protein FliD n=1 Tax=Paenibacillus sp. V4I3 TaxID=3042305 RepID=UPI002789BB97|nr:flagellar filament capping protein FliD [Paenibacillus sp. V4I3]MDQ0872144.1 flagellar hook-associated protein 2 [Paenibacillus sp. V4I3]